MLTKSVTAKVFTYCSLGEVSNFSNTGCEGLNGWDRGIKKQKSTMRHHLFFLGLRTSRIGLVDGEAVGVITPLLGRSYIMDFNS